VSCDDANVCTDDTCDPQSGCQHANNASACDDGDLCTSADQCAGGSCVGTPLVPCEPDAGVDQDSGTSSDAAITHDSSVMQDSANAQDAAVAHDAAAAQDATAIQDGSSSHDVVVAPDGGRLDAVVSRKDAGTDEPSAPGGCGCSHSLNDLHPMAVLSLSVLAAVALVRRRRRAPSHSRLGHSGRV
jgi:MYXO-CTERM domain-containing protein